MCGASSAERHKETPDKWYSNIELGEQDYSDASSDLCARADAKNMATVMGQLTRYMEHQSVFTFAKTM